MFSSKQQAREEIHRVIRTAWIADPLTTDAPLLVQSIKEKPPTSPDPNGWAKTWARVSVEHLSGSQVTLTDQNGKAKHVKRGVVTIQVFTPLGQGLWGTSDPVTDIIETALASKSASDLVSFTEITSTEVGEDGPWFQVNVRANFEYYVTR